MNISLNRMSKPGYVHVRAGHVVDVVHDHQVPVKSYDSNGHAEPYRRKFDTAWVTAKVGDIAVEIVAAKTGNVIGYTYFSGDAIALMSYTALASWFIEAKAWRVEFPAKPTCTTNQMLAAFIRCRYAPSPVRVVAFELNVPTVDDAKAAGAWFQNAARYVPDPPADDKASDKGVRVVSDDLVDELKPRSHILGLLWTRKGRIWNRDKTGGGAVLHFQPPHHACNDAAQAFQVALLLSSPHLEAVDIFDGEAFEKRLAPNENAIIHVTSQSEAS